MMDLLDLYWAFANRGKRHIESFYIPIGLTRTLAVYSYDLYGTSQVLKLISIIIDQF
jgi:hypothetical protein